MGLDITAASRIEKVDVQVLVREGETLKEIESSGALYDYAYDEGLLHVYANKDFPGREAPLEDGFYRVGGEQVSFPAGAYSGYNRYREALSVMALGVTPDAVWKNPQEYDGQPFVEQINFADNEGAIGSHAAVKLAGDYAAWEARAMGTLDEWDRDRYRRWRHAFTLAADEGVVIYR